MTLVKRLRDLQDHYSTSGRLGPENHHIFREAADKIERLEAAPVAVNELNFLNFIKAFWRAEPSCLHLNCNADCNPMTAHCGRDEPEEEVPRHNPDAHHLDGW